MSAPDDGAQAARLVTFLGLGRFDKKRDRYVYEPTGFEYFERRAAKTPYVCRALSELLQPSDIAVLATEEAQEHHKDALIEALRAGNHPVPRFIAIPSGGKPAELWRKGLADRRRADLGADRVRYAARLDARTRDVSSDGPRRGGGKRDRAHRGRLEEGLGPGREARR